MGGNLDYIFYNKNALRLLSMLEMPTFDQVSAEGGLPNSKFPSDHLRIEVVFQIMPEK